jgi:hypothetical protein
MHKEVHAQQLWMHFKWNTLYYEENKEVHGLSLEQYYLNTTNTISLQSLN